MISWKPRKATAPRTVSRLSPTMTRISSVVTIERKNSTSMIVMTRNVSASTVRMLSWPAFSCSAANADAPVT